MKIRKSALKQALKDMPIDHGDMFLMSQTEDLTDVCEVVEIMPWEASETERRLAALVALGLLEWVNEQGESLNPPRRDTQPNFYVAVTLRPKAPKAAADLFRQTESSVVALRTPEGLLLLDQATIHNDRSVFSRATLVWEKAQDESVFTPTTPPSDQGRSSKVPTTPARRLSHLDESMRSGARAVEGPGRRGVLERCTVVDVDAESRSAAFEQTLSHGGDRPRRD